MEHRRTPNGRAFVPPSWFIVLTVLVCVGAAGWLGWTVTRDGQDSVPVAGSTPAPATATPSPTAAATTTPAPTPTPSPTPSPTETIEVARTLAVSVLNNTGIPGVARAFSVKVEAAGWTVGGVGNWRGSVPGNTVYYPPNRKAEADLLAKDVAIGRVLPLVATMRPDRLTIILAGPQ